MTGTEDIKAKAEQVQAQAAALPSLDEVRDLAGRAVSHGGTPGMPIEEIRELAAVAVSRAEQVTSLLRQLSSLLADDARGGDP